MHLLSHVILGSLKMHPSRLNKQEKANVRLQTNLPSFGNDLLYFAVRYSPKHPLYFIE